MTTQTATTTPSTTKNQEQGQSSHENLRPGDPIPQKSPPVLDERRKTVTRRFMSSEDLMSQASQEDLMLLDAFGARVELIHAKMRTLPPFDKYPAQLEAVWPTIEARIHAEPQIAMGAISWVARVLAKIVVTRSPTGGMRIDPYSDDVVFRFDPVDRSTIDEWRGPPAGLARTYVQPYFTTQAMESLVRGIERCQFQVGIVHLRDHFSCTIKNGIPEIRHSILHRSATDDLQGGSIVFPRVTEDPQGSSIVNAYAYVTYDSDRLQPQVAVIGAERAESAKKRSMEPKLWDSDEADIMWRKTALRDLINSMPLSAELRSLFSLQRGGISKRMIIEGT